MVTAVSHVRVLSDVVLVVRRVQNGPSRHEQKVLQQQAQEQEHRKEFVRQRQALEEQVLQQEQTIEAQLVQRKTQKVTLPPLPALLILRYCFGTHARFTV